jgi:hypothetical protein
MRSVFQALSYHDRTMRQLGMNEFATLAAGAVGLDNQGHHADERERIY